MKDVLLHDSERPIQPKHWPGVMEELRLHKREDTPGVCSRAREEIEWLRRRIDYWSYCTWQGMLQHGPEHKAELLQFFKELGIHPYCNSDQTKGCSDE